MVLNPSSDRSVGTSYRADSLRVLIVSENVSMQMGGEASLPFYYFNLLRARQIDVFMICHERVREELRQTLPQEAFQRCRFVKDTPLQVALWQIGKRFPYRIHDLIFGQLIHWVTQWKMRAMAKQWIRTEDIQILFEPSPINPKGVSFMYDMGIPVVMGPLCGGLEFPPAFRYMDSAFSRFGVGAGRFLSAFANRLIPGKLKADVLIVANHRSAQALPRGYQGRLQYVIESGVDLDIWQPKAIAPLFNDYPEMETAPPPVRFVYSGRFVDWKGVQFLVDAFKQVAKTHNVVLELVGDGALRPEIEQQVITAGLQDRVKFHGWLTRQESAKLIARCDIFVMPSLRECGGTALLEAMAIGLPVIATDWAGPAQYVDQTCGILVPPTSIDGFVSGLAAAMDQLAQSPALRQQMGKAGRQRVRTQCFDWDAKTDRVIQIFHETLQTRRRSVQSLEYSAVP